MISASNAALLIFLLSYTLFVFFPTKRTLVAIIGSLLLIACGSIGAKEAFLAINWNVMGIFVGTLFVADIFLDSHMPGYLAERIVMRTKNVTWALLAICVMTGVISMFIENVATVLIVAPIAFSLAKKININPKNMMIAIAISSNLQGAATLIGDPPSMLLGGFAKMNFWDFFFYQGKMSVFFAIQMGALASFIVLYCVFKRHTERVEITPHEKIKTIVPTIILILLIFALAASSLFDKEFSFLGGIICMAFGLVSLLWDHFIHRDHFLKTLKSLDWDTTFFLMGIFVLVGSLTQNGWIEVIAEHLSSWVGSNVLLAYVLLVVISVVISAFVDNVPYLAAMLSVAMHMAQNLSVEPPLFLFGLLIGACLGGNITPIGASANIVACSMLKKEGYDVSFKEFGFIGIPFTLVATFAASVFVWFVWGPK
jgi:Na+/H+ antiporter NhaD/arsenite permease-like protein